MATYKPLSTDFKDDILASQNSKRKYTQVNNSDGTVSFQDSTAYSQVGSSYGAKEIIEEREAINNIYANKLVTLNEIDLVTEPGFFVDAQVVKELNSKIKNFNTDKTLWSGSVINENVELSDSIYNFRWIYIETEDGIASPILIRKDKNKYLTGYGYASNSNTIVTVTIKLTINTATNINILSYYADHKFNSGHPNLAAKRVTAIYGVPTYS